MRRHGCPLIRDAWPSLPPANAYRNERAEMKGEVVLQMTWKCLSGEIIVVDR